MLQKLQKTVRSPLAGRSELRAVQLQGFVSGDDKLCHVFSPSRIGELPAAPRPRPRETKAERGGLRPNEVLGSGAEMTHN